MAEKICFSAKKKKGGAAFGAAKEACVNFQEGRKRRECINTTKGYMQMTI